MQILQNLHRLKQRLAPQLDLAQIPVVSYLRKKVIYFSRKKIVDNVNGYTMHVDDIDTLALSWHHVFEPATTEFFKNNIKTGQAVIDLGANIGYYTLLFSGLVGANGHVYAFEPEPESAKILRKNLEINSVKNVTIIEMAVDNAVAKRKLHLSRVNQGNHQIFDSGEQRDTLEIQTTTLDAYFKNRDVKIDWIKMDIEGAEFRALQGMKKLVENNPSLILVSEIYGAGLTAAGTSVDEYIRELKSVSFDFEEIDERNKIITPVSAEQLIKNSSKHRRFHPNIICRRKI